MFPLKIAHFSLFLYLAPVKRTVMELLRICRFDGILWHIVSESLTPGFEVIYRLEFIHFFFAATNVLNDLHRFVIKVLASLRIIKPGLAFRTAGMLLHCHHIGAAHFCEQLLEEARFVIGDVDGECSHTAYFMFLSAKTVIF